MTNANDSFIRQRRNLIITSTLFIGYLIGDLNVNKLNFVIGTADINDAGNLLVLFYLIGLYFLYRFHCYVPDGRIRKFFLEVRDIGIEKKSNHIIEKVRREKRFDILKSVPEYLTDISNITVDVITTHKSGIGGTDDPHFRHYELIGRAVRDNDVIGKPRAYEYDSNDFEALYFYINSLFYHVINKSDFSEYIFPYVLFVITGTWFFFKIL